MALLLGAITVTFLIIFILTRRTYLYLKYDNGVTLEFHFVIISFKLTVRGEKGVNGESVTFYRKAVKGLFKLLSRSELVIKNITINNIKTDRFERLFAFPYGAMALIFMLFAYLEGNTEKIVFDDNAIELMRDGDKPSIDFRLYTELYNLVYFFFSLLAYKLIYRKKRIKGYVGN